MKLSTTFNTLVSISISAAAAQTTTPDDRSMLLIQSLGLKDDLPKPGYNMEGGSVFDNYVKAESDGQFFLVAENQIQFERPLSKPITSRSLLWCANLHFGDSNSTHTNGVGYTAQCVKSFLEDTIEKAEAEGVTLHLMQLTPDEFALTMSLSASYNAQTNMFNMVVHDNNDNYVEQYSDTGLPSMPDIGWETHDEGDTHPNAASSGLSFFGQATWVSQEEAALLLNNNATDFTPERFIVIHEKVWNAIHYNTTTNTDTDESSTNEEEGESTDVDTDESSGGNDEDSVTTVDTIKEEPKSDTANEEGDESSANNGRRLFVAITSMFSTLLGSSV